MTRVVASLAVVASLLLLAAIWMRSPAPAPDKRPVGVVLITLDTTRADRLSTYGFMDAAMPHLDRLGREGVIFQQANSVAPLTLPAHASLFTGLLPPAHGIRDNASRPLADEHVTLAEILRHQGFRTAAFVGSVILDRDRGLNQGFDHYSGVDGNTRPGSKPGQRTAEPVITEAISWIESIGDLPFFVWTHLYDPHRPYEPPEPFASRFGANPYIGEIAYADSQIGRLVEALDRRQLLDRSVVIVAGDHGESLGDHGERDHGIFLYESVLRVPLIIRAPSIAPRHVDSVVRVIDIMPTVLDLIGISPPAGTATSLVPAMRGNAQDLEAYSESLYPQQFGWSSLRALRDGRFKLIDAPRPELYDLESDPWEEHNIHRDRPELAAALAQRLATFSQPALAKGPAESAESSVDPEVRERLAALGYVAGRTPPTPAAGESLPDPKDCIAFYNARQEAIAVPPESARRCGG